MAARAGRFFGRFFGRTIGDAASFAIGGSISRTIDPVLQQVENEAWQSAVAAGAVRPLDAEVAAGIVAEGVERRDWGAGQAAQGGIGGEQFDALLGEALNAPGIGELLRLWRREAITDADFLHGLHKAKMEGRWEKPLETLRDERLDPAVLAVAIQRGIVTDPGFLPVGPPTAEGKVPKFPVSPLNALTEAAAAGINEERLFVETAIVGNPASPDLAARMTFRGIIDETDYARAISEGNTRNEWAAPLFDGFRQIATAHDGIEGRLRGWLTDGEMYEQTARHGMSREDTDLLFKLNGRPPSWHQIWIGLARGGTYDGPQDIIHPAFLKGLQESNLRPEWYNLLWHSRYNYPSAFVLRALTTGGSISGAEAEQVLLYEGWEPTFAAKVAASWSGAGTAGSATPTKSYTTSAVRAISKSYIALKLDRAKAAADLTALGVPAADQPALFKIWDVTREATVKSLTPTQIANRFKRQQISLAEALTQLEALGYDPEDAAALLNVAAPLLTVTQIQKGLGATITYAQALAALTEEGYTAEQILELIGPAPDQAKIDAAVQAFRAGTITYDAASSQLAAERQTPEQIIALIGPHPAAPPPTPPAGP
jgi:hypothetical protein